MLVIAAVMSFAVMGCKKHPTPLTVLPGAREGNPGEVGQGQPLSATPGTDSTGAPTGIAANPAGSHAGWTEDKDSLKDNTVYFAYDSSVIRESEKSKVSAVADYLKAHADAAVRVEGNCDERGTDEYNRALGERRAIAGREELVSAGIDASRVDTISYGKDRPIEPLHSEAAWSKNRRDDFVVLTAPK